MKRTLGLLAAFGLVVTGIALIYPPFAFIAAGVLLAALVIEVPSP